MGGFQRRVQRQNDQDQEAVDYEQQPGKEVLRAKVQQADEVGHPPIIHHQFDGNGAEISMAVATLIGSWILAVHRQTGADAGLELAGMMSEIQAGAANMVATQLHGEG